MSELYLPSTGSLHLPAPSYELSRAAAERYTQLSAAQQARGTRTDGHPHLIGDVVRRRTGRGRSRGRLSGRTAGTRWSR